MLCGLENTKNTSYTEVTRASKNCYRFSTEVLQKIKSSESNVQFSSIVQLRLCEFDLVAFKSFILYILLALHIVTVVSKYCIITVKLRKMRKPEIYLWNIIL